MRVAGICIAWPVMRSRVVSCVGILPNFHCCIHPEFIMIHHLARAFFVRNNAGFGAGNDADNPPQNGNRPANAPIARPVKPRPITPWTSTPTRQSVAHSAAAVIPDPSSMRRVNGKDEIIRRV